MSHHFDGTSFSLPRCTQFYMSSELKIGTHHISSINIRYTILTSQRNPCHYGIATAFFSVCCYKCWHIFIHCDDDNVRCYYAMQTARPVQQANKTTPHQTKTNTSRIKNRNKQILYELLTVSQWNIKSAKGTGLNVSKKANKKMWSNGRKWTSKQMNKKYHVRDRQRGEKCDLWQLTGCIFDSVAHINPQNSQFFTRFDATNIGDSGHFMLNFKFWHFICWNKQILQQNKFLCVVLWITLHQQD